jgi:hypothetical protein
VKAKPASAPPRGLGRGPSIKVPAGRGIAAEPISGFHDDLIIALGLAVLFDPFKQRVKRGPSVSR